MLLCPLPVRRTSDGQCVWLLPVEDEERAAARIRESSVEARLTPKDKEVFAFERRINPEIAGELYISLYTVKNHVSGILRKLGLKSRCEIS